MRTFHCQSCVFGGRLASREVKAKTPAEARRKFRKKFTRGAFAGYSILVRELP